MSLNKNSNSVPTARTPQSTGRSSKSPVERDQPATPISDFYLEPSATDLKPQRRDSTNSNDDKSLTVRIPATVNRSVATLASESSKRITRNLDKAVRASRSLRFAKINNESQPFESNLPGSIKESAAPVMQSQSQITPTSKHPATNVSKTPTTRSKIDNIGTSKKLAKGSDKEAAPSAMNADRSFKSLNPPSRPNSSEQPAKGPEKEAASSTTNADRSFKSSNLSDRPRLGLRLPQTHKTATRVRLLLGQRRRYPRLTQES